MIGSRVSVVGSSGSGKTTVAAALSRELGFDHVELDALHWRPDWMEMSAADLQRALEPTLDGDGWIVDGNYGGKARELVWSRADTVVWLDLPRPVVMAALARRTAGRIVFRRELWNGNRERLRHVLSLDERKNLLVWTWRHFSRYRATYESAMTHPAYSHLAFTRLRSRRDVARLLQTVTLR